MTPRAEQALRDVEEAIEKKSSHSIIKGFMNRFWDVYRQGDEATGKGEVEKRVKACRLIGACGNFKTSKD